MAVSRKIANFAAQCKFLSKRLLDSQNIRLSLSLLHFAVHHPYDVAVGFVHR